MAANSETPKTVQTRHEKLIAAFKKHGIKRHMDAWIRLKEIMGPELEKTTLEEVRKNAWRVR